MSSNELLNDFEEATAAYQTAVYRPDLPSEQREAAAVTFQDWINQFQEGGVPAIEELTRMLSSEDALGRNAAARLLVELNNPEALARLIAALDQFRVLPVSQVIFRRLGMATPLPEGLWKRVDAVAQADRGPLIEALLRHPTETGRAFFERMIAAGDTAIADAMIKAVAGWQEPELLWGIVNGPPLIPSTNLPLWMARDARIDAAFYLGLAGDRNAIQFLDTLANGHDAVTAAQATVHLAYLAWPGAVRPAAALLGADVTNNPAVKGLALEAAAALSSAALGPALLDLIGQPPTAMPGFPPLPDEAIRVLWGLTGRLLPEHMIGYDTNAVIETFTPSTRLQAVPFYERILHGLEPTRRYHGGELLTLNHLVDDLLSPHGGPSQVAAYNLRAMTGEDYRFDPDADLIANLPAIKLWRERAARLELAEPGTWVFYGTPLPDPAPLG